MNTGDRVQVWDGEKHLPMGWGTIIRKAVLMRNGEEVPLIQLENGRKVWGDDVDWIPEKKAVEIGVRLFKDVMGKKEGR